MSDVIAWTRRWWCKTFRTTVRPASYNRYRGRVLTTEEWEAAGGWAGAMVSGYEVRRPDWWAPGCTSAVTDDTPKAARAALDEWQDDMWRRATSEL